MKRLKEVLANPLPGGLCPVPDEPLGRVPVTFGVINVWVYGITSWGDFFTTRQKLAMTTFVNLLATGHRASGTIPCVLAQTLSHVLDRNTSLCRWRPEPYMETVESTYGRQALPIVWDFAEAVPLSDLTGSFNHALEVVAQCLQANSGRLFPLGQVQPADALKSPLPDEMAGIWFTDPPYYDSVPYSYISDFFYVWLRRSIGKLLPSLSQLILPLDHVRS